MNDGQKILYQQACRTLELQGFDLSDVYRQNKRLEDLENSRVLKPEDFMFQVTTPESWADHFEREFQVGSVTIQAVNGPKELHLGNVRLGGQFTLSPAWRGVLRERCGMTPTATITVSLLEYFKETKVISRIRIESNQHIADQKNRKHILQSYVIDDFTSFMLMVKRSEEMRVEADDVDKKVRSAKSTGDNNNNDSQKTTKIKVDSAAMASEYLM